MVKKASPVAPKPDVTMPVLAEEHYYHEIVRCYANRSLYKGSIPTEKLDRLDLLVKGYEREWLKNDRYRWPIYAGNFGREVFVKQFPKNGEQMFLQIMQLRNAALPGDVSSLSSLPLMDFQNMLSAMVFSGGLMPAELQKLADSLYGTAGPEAKCKDDSGVESKRRFNKLAQKEGVPVAFLTPEKDGIAGFCLLRVYKYDPHTK